MMEMASVGLASVLLRFSFLGLPGPLAALALDRYRNQAPIP